MRHALTRAGKEPHVADRKHEGDKAKARIEEAKGKVREETGDLLGNEQMEAEGKGEKWKGKAKGAMADVREKADNAMDAAKDRMRR
jgi:uncharacterized protein YjbJ (UPF0337 family)